MTTSRSPKEVLDRVLADPRVQAVLAKMSENPKPKAVCPNCWFELRTTEEIEEHECPPTP